MQKQLLPTDLTEHSLEAHFARCAAPTRALYPVVLLAVVAALAALPLIRVEVTVRSAGIIRPSVERHVIRAQASGIVETVGVREGERVVRGELLLALRDGPVREELARLDSLLRDSRDRVLDLERITRAADPADAPGALRTHRYRDEWLRLQREMAALAAREQHAARARERAAVLASSALLPAAEAEEHAFRLAQVQAERGVLLGRHRDAWHLELVAARAELAELLARRGRAAEQRELHRQLAPVSGTVEQVAALSPGSFVQAGEQLALVSPAAPLVAEVLVSPRDVGLLRVGTPVRMQVEAFNFRDWGVVPGRVLEISDDFVLAGERPMFRVRASLGRTELRLRSGARAGLRKGMTLQARFVVAERTLLQLLHDDLADWFDPRGGAGGAA
jgi:multidrug resistance efflux pump